MAERRDSDLIQDIHEAINRIQRYAAGLTYQAFLKDTKTQDAVARNFEILGEAAKGLSADFRRKHREINWKDIAGMRDRLIHHYFGVNWEIVWDVIQSKLPDLKAQLVAMLDQ